VTVAGLGRLQPVRGTPPDTQPPIKPP
jgi:hypothetical protein